MNHSEVSKIRHLAAKGLREMIKQLEAAPEKEIPKEVVVSALTKAVDCVDQLLEELDHANGQGDRITRH